MPDDPSIRCTTCGRPLPQEGAICPACTNLAQTVSPAEAAPVDLIAGRYLPQRMLGRGGAKEVWLAHDLTLDRPVAIARARAGAAGAEARERMRREARLMARLGDHPNIVTVYDAVQDGEALHIVARFMAGGSLAERLAAAPGGRLEVGDVLRTGRSLADALAHAHEHGVVHRDVKPDNVWLGADGSAGLGDFGIAVAAGDPVAGSATGTPYYQAPEQAAGKPPLAQSDLYALGATLWELLCGRPPFIGPDAVALLAQHRHAAPEPPSRHAAAIAPGLDALILSLLAKRAADRPADAAAVRDALDRLGGAPSVPVAAVPSDREPLVGRETELASLHQALDAARDGGVRVVAIGGEPGIGKTRIVDEAAAEAGARGAAVVRGRADEDARAYGPWRGALRPLVAAASGLPARVLDDVRRLTGDGRPPEVPAAGAAAEPADGEEERLRMFDAVAELVRATARERPLFVALEDVHVADRSSLALLSHLTAGTPDAHLLLVVTYRTAELGAGHALAGILDALERDRRLTRLALHGLPEAAIIRFLPPDVRVAPAAIHALHERTAGNPFFVRELVRLLAERGALGGDGSELPALVPDRVREVVGRRLEPLDPETREVLAIAGVVGRPFTIARVARVGGLGREVVARALEPALAGRLVEARPDAPGMFGFAHAIVRDAVYDELAPALRARLHAAVAALLQESREAGGEATAAEAAHHALSAARCGADPKAAWELSREAAREAAELQAHAEAAAHYAGALEALELGAEASAAEQLETRLALAAASFAAGDIVAARRRFRTVAAAARRSGAAEVQARAAIGFSEVQQYAAIDEDAIALLQGALDALPPDDSALRARACGLLGLRLDPVTDQARREALLDDGVAMARRLGDERALVALQSAAALVNWPPERAAQRAAAADEVLALAGRGADVAAVFWARTIKLRDALEAGRLAGGRRGARTARAARRGEPPHLLSLVPARPAGGARAVRRAARRRRAAGRGGRRPQPPPRRRRRPGAHGPAAGARDAAPAPPGRPARRAARLRRPLRDAAGVGGDARPGRARPARGRRPAQRRRLRARRLRRAAAHARLAVRARAARRAGRRRRHAGGDRAAHRGARPARRPQRGDGRRVGGVRSGGPPAGRAGRRRGPARGRRAPLRARGRARRRVGRAGLGARGHRRLDAQPRGRSGAARPRAGTGPRPRAAVGRGRARPRGRPVGVRPRRRSSRPSPCRERPRSRACSRRRPSRRPSSSAR